jgi:hypothetical protein
VSLWIAETQRTLSEDIAAKPGDVRDFYVDLDNVGVLHPFVVDLRATAHSATPEGYRDEYRVRERIPIGPFRLLISFPTWLDVTREGDVTSEVRQFPLVRLYNRIAFEPITTGTRIVERLRISAPRPLTAFTTREAVAAHTRVLAGIRDHFAAERD